MQPAPGEEGSQATLEPEWSPPAGDWLARHGGGELNLLLASGAEQRPGSASQSSGASPGSTAEIANKQMQDADGERGRARSPSAVDSSGSAARIQQQLLERQRQRSLSRPSSGRGLAAAPVASYAVGASPSTSSSAAAILSRPARPMLLPRSRFPAAGGGVAPGAPGASSRGTGSTACSTPQASPSTLPISPSAAAFAAGAIASGRPLPKSLQPSATPSAPSAAASRDALASMQARLSHVEKLNQNQAAKLAKLNQEVEALRAENSILRQSFLEGDGWDAEDDDGEEISRKEALQTLRAERDQYKAQVQEMTKFLQDYGLTWVGDSEVVAEETAEGEEVSPSPSSKPSQKDDAVSAGNGGTVADRLSRPTSATGCNVDIQVMVSRVEGLNSSVQQEGARVVASRVGGAVHARLVADDSMPLPLTFFKDGVKLGACPFHSYSSSPAQSLIRDILDGFFPYDLKDDYPDGVMLKVIDRASLPFSTWLKEYASSDRDLDGRADRLALAAGRALNVPAKKTPLGHGPAEQQLRGGNAGVRGASAPSRSSMAAATSEVSLLEAGRDPSKPIAKLQVKLTEGCRVVVCMEPNHTVGELEDALERWCAEQGTAGLKGSHLKSAFPPRIYSDRSQSLADAGLTPSATLFVAGEAAAAAA